MKRRVEFDAAAVGRLRETWHEQPRPDRRALGLFALILLLLLHGSPNSGSFRQLLDLDHDPDPDRVVAESSVPISSSVRIGAIAMKRTTQRIASMGMSVASIGAAAAAAELHVPSKQFPTIQAAVNASASGDVITVAPGTYAVGTLTMPAFAVTVRGTGNPSLTVLTGEGVEIFGGAGVRSLEQLTLRGCSGYGAVHVNGAAAALRSVVIEDCEVHGVFVNTNASLETTDCSIIRNARGGFVYVNSSWTATDCLFESNGDPAGAYGGAVGFHIGCNANFLRCDFIGNAAGQGGAIGLSFSGNRVFDSCYFENNTSPNGPVWWTEFGATGVLSNATLCGHGLSDMSGSWIDGGGNEFFPDGCTPPCPGDFINDGVVNAADMSVLLNFWGTNGAGFEGVDLDGDGVVSAADLSILLSNWGACPQ